MRFLAEPTIALYLMSNVKGLLPNKIKQRLECDHNKSLYLLQTSVVFGGVRQQKRFLHWKRGKVSVEWGNVGYTMWDVLCGICYVVVEYAMWDVLWLNLNWGTTLWALLHLNEESGLEKGDLKFWLRESQEWWWWWWRWGWRKWPYPISDRHQWKTLASFPSNRLRLNSYETLPKAQRTQASSTMTYLSALT